MCIYIYICIYMCVYIYIYMYRYVYILYIYIYIHTYNMIHIHIDRILTHHFSSKAQGRSSYNRGLRLWRSQRPAEAAQLFRSAALNGHGKGAYALGVMLLKGALEPSIHGFLWVFLWVYRDLNGIIMVFYGFYRDFMYRDNDGILWVL